MLYAVIFHNHVRQQAELVAVHEAVDGESDPVQKLVEIARAHAERLGERIDFSRFAQDTIASDEAEDYLYYLTKMGTGSIRTGPAYRKVTVAI
jgi:hypothetical protein